MVTCMYSVTVYRIEKIVLTTCIYNIYVYGYRVKKHLKS